MPNLNAASTAKHIAARMDAFVKKGKAAAAEAKPAASSSSSSLAGSSGGGAAR